MRVSSLILSGSTGGKHWRLAVTYLEGMDMLRVVWMPENGYEPFVINGHETGARVRTYDEATRVLTSHPASIANTFDFLAGHCDNEPKGAEISPFSLLPKVRLARTIAEFVELLSAVNGFSRLQHFPRDLMDKIGFVPMSLLTAMLPVKEAV